MAPSDRRAVEFGRKRSAPSRLGRDRVAICQGEGKQGGPWLYKTLRGVAVYRHASIFGPMLRAKETTFGFGVTAAAIRDVLSSIENHFCFRSFNASLD